MSNNSWLMNYEFLDINLRSTEWNLREWKHYNNPQIFEHDFQNDSHLDIFLSPWKVNVRKNGRGLAYFLVRDPKNQLHRL